MSTQPQDTRKWDAATDGTPPQGRRNTRSTAGYIIGLALTLIVTRSLVPLAMSHVRVSQPLALAIELAIYAAAIFIFYTIFNAVARRNA
jgi:hypothetical protein